MSDLLETLQQEGVDPALLEACLLYTSNGTITIGDIQAFIQYVKNFTQPIQQLSQVSNLLQSMAAAAERVFEFLNEPEEDQQADPARRADPGCINEMCIRDRRWCVRRRRCRDRRSHRHQGHGRRQGCCKGH